VEGGPTGQRPGPTRGDAPLQVLSFSGFAIFGTTTCSEEAVMLRAVFTERCSRKWKFAHHLLIWWDLTCEYLSFRMESHDDQRTAYDAL
jgi:hypothetical protein